MGKCERSAQDTVSMTQAGRATQSANRKHRKARLPCRTCRPIDTNISVCLQLLALTSPPSTVVYCLPTSTLGRQCKVYVRKHAENAHPLTLICCTREALSPNDRLGRHALSRVRRWERRSSLSSAVSEARRRLTYN